MSEAAMRLAPVSDDINNKGRIDTDCLLQLIEAGLCGDFNLVRRVSRLLLDGLPTAQATAARARLDEITRKNAPLAPSSPPRQFRDEAAPPSVQQSPWPTEPLFLEERVSSTVARFVEEAAAAARLQSAGLGSRSNLLLAGPPGTGKTTIAGHVAARLGRPCNVVRLDGVMSSMLGGSARNLRSALDAAGGRDGFLFIDEVDAIGKERGDDRDVGEVKRLVNTFIQALDALPSHAVVIAATNHPELLDRAIWRRFPFQVDLGLPSAELRGRLWGHNLEFSTAMRRTADALAIISDGLSGSDIREIARSARRLALLDEAPLDMASVTEAVLDSLNGRLSTPRRIGPAEKAGLRTRLALDERLTVTARALLRGVSQQAETRAAGRRKAAR